MTSPPTPSSVRPPANGPADDCRDLTAPIPGAPGAGVFATFVTAIFTFGLWPALVWPVRFSHLAIVEHKRLTAVANWLRFRSAHPEAKQLDKALDRVRFNP